MQKYEISKRNAPARHQHADSLHEEGERGGK